MKLTFGEKIRNLREEQNINQTQLGSAVNMTQRKISYIECDRYEPSIDRNFLLTFRRKMSIIVLSRFDKILF